MLRCRICNCYCDPSDLENMVCDDCRAELERQQSQKEKAELLMSAEFRQMHLKEMFRI